MRLFWSTILTLLALAVVACSEPTPTPTPRPTPTHTPTPTPPNAEDIYTYAAQLMEFIRFHVSGEVHKQGEAPRLKVEYDLELPDRFRLSVEIIEEPQPFNVSLVGIKDDLYFRPFQSQDWFVIPKEQQSKYTPADVLGIFKGFRTQVSDLTYLGEQTVDVTPSYHIRGTIGPEVMGLFQVGEKPTMENGTLEAWIGMQDFYIRRIQITQGTDIATLNLSRFFDVSVVAPSEPRPFEELQTLLATAPEEIIPGGLPQTPEEVKAFIEDLPASTQTCLRQAIGDAAFDELLAATRMPTFQEVPGVVGCFGPGAY